MRRRDVVAAAIAATAPFGCNQILGVQELTFNASDGGGSADARHGRDGAAGIDAQGDGSRSDGGAARCDAAGVDGNDPHNCGACGHDCLGGTCVAGACTPFVVASSQVAPGVIAVDGKSVYWGVGGAPLVDGGINTGAIMAWPKAGGAATVLLKAKQTNVVQSLVSDGTYLYFATPYNYASINRFLPANPSFSLEGLSTSPIPRYHPLSVALGGQGLVFWVDGALTGSAVSAVEVWGDAGNRLLTKDPTTGASTAAVGGGYVYFSSGTDSSGHQVVRAIPQEGCPDAGACAVTVSNDGGLPLQALVLTTDDAYVYWAVPMGGYVERRPLGTGTANVTRILSNRATPVAIAVDDRYIYWTEHVAAAPGGLDAAANTGGQVGYAPKDGSPGGGILATGQGYPAGLVLDTNAVYWTDMGDPYGTPDSNGQVMGIAKPL